MSLNGQTVGQTELDWYLKSKGYGIPKPGKRLAKMQGRILGWPADRPLPERFTACPDMEHPIGSDHFNERRKVIVHELEPLALDDRLTFIDLFAGCGGFSLGFIQSGARCVAMVEYDYWATMTFCFNIPSWQSAEVHVYRKDIRDVSGHEIMRNAGLDEVDAIIGGPPCQSFSRAGSREIGDPRDSLLWEFGRIIKEINPKTFVMENVPDIRTKRFPNGELVLKAWGRFMGLPESFGDLPKKKAKGAHA